MDQPAPDAQERLVAPDLIRGVAVLGILAINIVGFAGPAAAAFTPNLLAQAGFPDELAFAAGFVLFEGKMRALFSLLFGASMALFIARANARGAFGEWLQLRRLTWLAVFGMAHYFLFWWGDILFLYAVSGLFVLFLHEMRTRTLLVIALALFGGWTVSGIAMTLPDVLTEEHVRTGKATAEEIRDYAEVKALWVDKAHSELRDVRSGFLPLASTKFTERPFYLLEMALYSLGETVPLMLIGMALYRLGFFAGAWSRKKLGRMAGWCGGTGLILTLAILAWIWPRHFPVQAMYAATVYWAALPHLLMALCYAALLVLAAPAIAGTALGRRLIAAGRMAFSNYLGSTVVMTAIFYGWGLNLVGRVPPAVQWLFVALGWCLMLAWSRPWLQRYRYGPMEWLWRCLTWRHLFALKR